LIPVLKPELPNHSKWTKYLNKSYKFNQFSNNGPCVQLLEERLQKYISLKNKPLLVCNATLGLEIVLKSLNLDSKAEVLIPSFTFAATCHSVINSGLIPKIVDCDKDMFLCLDSSKKSLSKKTKVMLVVQALGFSCDYKKYEKFAKENNLILIFDSAACLGAVYDDGSKVGSAGDFEIFSLHATKTFGIGEGGLITSKNIEVLERCRRHINFGFHNFEAIDKGSNAKMSEIQAAVGLAVLDSINKKFNKRKRIANTYLKKFKKTSFDCVDKNSAWQVFPILFNSKVDRDKAIDILNNNKIGTRVYYIPLHTHSYFKKYAKNKKFINSDYFYNRILCIPMFESLSISEIEKITAILLKEF